MATKLTCALCDGPINPGEPVVQLEYGGLAHRFRQTCDHEILGRVKNSPIKSRTFKTEIYDDKL